MSNIKKMTRKLTAIGLSLIMVAMLSMSAMPLQALAESGNAPTTPPPIVVNDANEFIAALSTVTPDGVIQLGDNFTVHMDFLSLDENVTVNLGGYHLTLHAFMYMQNDVAVLRFDGPGTLTNIVRDNVGIFTAGSRGNFTHGDVYPKGMIDDYHFAVTWFLRLPENHVIFFEGMRPPSEAPEQPTPEAPTFTLGSGANLVFIVPDVDVGAFDRLTFGNRVLTRDVEFSAESYNSTRITVFHQFLNELSLATGEHTFTAYFEGAAPVNLSFTVTAPATDTPTVTAPATVPHNVPQTGITGQMVLPIACFAWPCLDRRRGSLPQK